MQHSAYKLPRRPQLVVELPGARVDESGAWAAQPHQAKVRGPEKDPTRMRAPGAFKEGSTKG